MKISDSHALTASAVEVRGFDASDHDYHSLAELACALYPDRPVTAGEMRARDQRARSRLLVRRLATDPGNGRLLGRGQYARPPEDQDEGCLYLWIEVLPQHRCCGVGTALHDSLVEHLETSGGGRLQCFVPRDSADGVRFVTRRGFRAVQEIKESHLDPRRVDAARFARHLDRFRDAGLRVTTVAEERRREPRWLERLHALHAAVWQDIPGPNLLQRDLDRFAEAVLEAPGALPEAHFLAVEGERYVGVTQVVYRPERPDEWVQVLTGTLRGQRGNGIATVLRVHLAAVAVERGCRVIKAFLDPANHAMVAVHDRLGFVDRPGTLRLERAVPARRREERKGAQLVAQRLNPVPGESHHERRQQTWHARSTTTRPAAASGPRPPTAAKRTSPTSSRTPERSTS